MKKRSLILLFAAGMILSALPALASSPALLGWNRFHGRVIVRGGWGWGWGWGGWGWGWGWGHPFYAYEPYYGYSYGPPVWARVKTDVSPEEAWVYLDGRLIGTADDFDGWPDYLYLRRGHYRLEFRLEGFEPKTVEIDARPGTTVKVDDHLKKIPGAKRYGSYEGPKIEGGIRRFWGKRRDAAEALDPREESYRDEQRYSSEEESDRSVSPRESDRVPRRREPAPDSDWRGDRRSADATVEGSRSQSGSTKGRVRLHVEPFDAAVYVDDRFVGTAEEVNSLEKGVAVSSGKHTVTVSRPGFKDRSVEIEISSGGSEKLEISLSR